MSESAGDAADLVPDLVRAGAFTRRPASWVTVRDGRFFKIPRVSNSLEADAQSSAALEQAVEQYESTGLLARISDDVVRHVDFVRECACLVALELPGPELLAEVRRARRSGEAACLVEEGCGVLARIHRGAPSAIGGLPPYDYANDAFLPAAPEQLDAIARADPMIVCGGFEIRNLMRDASGRLRFFDVHHAWLGIAEHDLMRYVVSVLMLNWGRRLVRGPWSGFSLEGCIGAYERERGVAVDRALGAYSFRLCAAMRRSHAARRVAQSPIWMRGLMHLYLLVFFGQVDRWAAKHGL